MARPNSMETQRKEFDAVEKLNKASTRLFQTAIVDDDYPAMRFAYEGALASFLKALKENGRFDTGNRYKIVTA